MDKFEVPTKINLEYAESQVRFSICDCSLDKRYSFWSLNKGQARKFLDRLRYIEKMTWKQLSGLGRKNGLTLEKLGSSNFELIHNQSTYEGNFLEQYYFHIRVEQTRLFRVFGYQKQNFFCITHIDPNGRVNH